MITLIAQLEKENTLITIVNILWVLQELNIKHKGSFGKGVEKWIHYAVRPMQNYFDQYRKKHISQCYASMPGDDEGFPMFFLDFRYF